MKLIGDAHARRPYLALSWPAVGTDARVERRVMWFTLTFSRSAAVAC